MALYLFKQMFEMAHLLKMKNNCGKLYRNPSVNAGIKIRTRLYGNKCKRRQKDRQTMPEQYPLRLSPGDKINCTTLPSCIRFCYQLTHYQTTNFRLFQSERVCRRQFQQIWWKWQKVIQTGRKHCGKRRNCSLRAIFPFTNGVFKRLVSQGHQKVSLCGNAF